QRIDVVAFLHGAHAAYTRIFVGEAAHEVVQQPLAHRTLGDADSIDAEVLDDFQQDGEAAGKHGRALGIHVGQVEIIDVAGGNDPVGETAQIIHGDTRRIWVQAAHDV